MVILRMLHLCIYLKFCTYFFYSPYLLSHHYFFFRLYALFYIVYFHIIDLKKKKFKTNRLIYRYSILDISYPVSVKSTIG